MGVRVRYRDGAWWVFITYRGKRKAKRIGDRRAAEEVASKLRARLQLGDLSPLEEEREVFTFQAYAERWLETYVAPNCKPRTLELYGLLCRRHLFAPLGAVKLADITREHNRKRAPRSHRSPRPSLRPSSAPASGGTRSGWT